MILHKGDNILKYKYLFFGFSIFFSLASMLWYLNCLYLVVWVFVFVDSLFVFVGFTVCRFWCLYFVTSVFAFEMFSVFDYLS